MTPTLWLSGLRYHLRHRWQLVLAVVGIALGVAVVVAVDLANESARRAFALSMESIAGQATHQIVGSPLGIDEALYARLRSEGLHPSAPVVEGFAESRGRTFRLLGLDPFAEPPFRPHLSFRSRSEIDLNRLLTEPGTVVISRSNLRELELGSGDSLELDIGGRPAVVKIAGTMDSDDRMERQALDGMLVADIATAQELLDMVGRLSHIDLILEPAEVEPIRTRLPSGIHLQRAENRTRVMEQMTRAFSVNLTALSLLALLVGLFLIYNTMTFSVVQRRPLLGNLRALGASRREIFWLIAGEALFLGAVGTAIGIGVGIALAQGLLGLVTRTINDLYFVLNVTALTVTPTALAKAVLLGLGATLAAAVAPALEATRTPPRLITTRSREEIRYRTVAPRAAAIGGVAMATGGLLLLYPSQALAPGFIALFLIILGFALGVPWITGNIVALAERLGRRRLATPERLALRGVRASLSRTAVAIAALAVAVSVSVGMAVMVESFRQTVHQWLQFTLQADIYVSPGSAVSARRSPPLLPEVISRVRQTSGVADLSTYRGLEVGSEFGPIQLQALHLNQQSRTGYRFRSGEPKRIWPAFEEGAVLVSEPFAHRSQVVPGDRLNLDTASGARTFPIAGIFYDYESDRGTVVMARAVYEQWFADQTVSGLGVYLEPGADVEQTMERLQSRVSDLQGVRIRSNRDIREASLAIFDRTFTITEILRLLAVAVAFTGVFSALMALQLEKAREFAILRAIGMTPGELWRLVTLQTGVMGLIAGLLALPLGLLLAAILIEVINRRAFGWTLWLQLPPEALIQGVLLAVAAALLAGLYPAHRLASSPPATALQEE
ncbi:ABC transporter permease [Thiohalomonas denitrificans]|uniref:Putative ABC transport system permease protein n=1 Tax=Thiohalomonas denitrificans TaxID=415747 RepID=A0A1G5PLF3_9GAMM|nr:ABC transporter permease [Thiohalomonas denitrificans]SCZ50273.1 putative ABC transport system permease protein [Thiohalomonas denitrificans]